MDAYFSDIEIHITLAINTARERLLIAVAWFTNEKIAEKLLTLSNKEINIEIIVDDNEINRRTPCLKELINKGISVKFVKNLSKESNIMHDKFCVIDSEKVLTGSYNWTKNAINNDENIIIIKNSEVANLYSIEFRRLKNIDASSRPIDFSEEDKIKINKYLVSDIKSILEEGVRKKVFIKNAVIDKNNPKVNSLVRRTIELSSININNLISDIFKHENLIKAYGVNYKQLATKEELALEKDQYKKNEIREFDNLVQKAIFRFKIDAVETITSAYTKLFAKKSIKNDDVERILKVIMYLNKEKFELLERKNNCA